MVQCRRISSVSTFPSPAPFPSPRAFLCSTLYLQSSIWSTEQLSVELFMQKEIEELARPQEQLLEMHGWLGPDAWIGG